MPIVMKAFDFVLGLRSRRVAQGDFVKVQRPAELREGVGLVGEEEGMVIDIEGQRQAAGEEGGGQIIEMGGERLGGIKAREREQAAVIIERLEQVKAGGQIGELAMRGSVVLPELADLLGLPAAERLWSLLVAGVRRTAIGDRPPADAGAIKGEAVPAEQLGSSAAGGKWRRTREQRAQGDECLWRPTRQVIATRSAGLPASLTVLGAGAQIISVERVKATAAKLEFGGRLAGGDLAAAKPCEHVPDERRRMAAA